MANAVFIASSHSHYQDRPGEAYHFPGSYLSRVQQTLGDWVILYEGRRGGNRGYYAVQRVESISPDPNDPTHYFATFGEGLDFENKLPRLKHDGQPYEYGLPLTGGNNSSSVRIISKADFNTMIEAALTPKLIANSHPRQGPLLHHMSEEAAPFLGPERSKLLSSRAFRDQAFSRVVKHAYDARCAMSGLKLRNGGGRAEVEAAHILPVAERGPDIIANGLALSGTLHWMFDRGLLSVDQDWTILASQTALKETGAERLLTPDRKLLLPANSNDWPDMRYLDWHRANRFKG